MKKLILSKETIQKLDPQQDVYGGGPATLSCLPTNCNCNWSLQPGCTATSMAPTADCPPPGIGKTGCL